MGLKMFSDEAPNTTDGKIDYYDKKPQLGEPQARNFTILEEDRRGMAVVVAIRYPDATAYGGIKILVYSDINKFHALLKTGTIDPHFLENSYSPVARFEPTPLGVGLAYKTADLLSEMSKEDNE